MLQVVSFHLEAEAARGRDKIKMTSERCRHYFSDSVAAEEVANAMEFAELAYRKLHEMVSECVSYHFVKVLGLYHRKIREAVLG